MLLQINILFSTKLATLFQVIFDQTNFTKKGKKSSLFEITFDSAHPNTY